MDMAEGYDSGTEEEKVLKAIEELGRPGKLAENYIGPEVSHKDPGISEATCSSLR